MKIIIQTLPYEIFKESEKINSLFSMGLEVLHLRKPKYSNKKLSNIIEGVEEKYHSRIVLHSNFSLLKKYSLGGIHVELEKMNSLFYSLYYKYLKSNFNLSISTTLNLKKTKIHDNLDYCFAGPVFKKFSEETIIKNINLFELSNKIKDYKIQTYALGCFTVNNIHAIKNAGFTGPVLQSYIWKSSDIINSFESLKYEFKKNNDNINKLAI